MTTTCITFDARGIPSVHEKDVSHYFLHAKIGDIDICSPSIDACQSIMTVEQVHAFNFPPPFNRYLVPRDAVFTDASQPITFDEISRMVQECRADAKAARDVLYSLQQQKEDDQSDDDDEFEENEDEDDNEEDVEEDDDDSAEEDEGLDDMLEDDTDACAVP
jgi:hypothetical protein